MGVWRESLDARRLVQVAALLAAAAAAAFLLGVPAYSGSGTAVSADGTVTTTSTGATLAEVNGLWVVGLLAVPVVLMAVHTLWVGRGRTAAIVACTAPVALLSLVGILTVGVFFLPAVVLSGVSLLVPARQPAAHSPGLPA